MRSGGALRRGVLLRATGRCLCPAAMLWHRGGCVLLERLGWLLVGTACWALSVFSILATLSWLVRRPFIYAATMREFGQTRIPPTT